MIALREPYTKPELREITPAKPKVCRTCHGTGEVPASYVIPRLRGCADCCPMMPCPECNAEGLQ